MQDFGGFGRRGELGRTREKHGREHNARMVIRSVVCVERGWQTQLRKREGVDEIDGDMLLLGYILL